MSKIDIKAMIKDLKKNELTELISVAQEVLSTLFNSSEIRDNVKESRFSKGYECPKCQCKDVNKNGKSNGRQRYICKRCRTSFDEFTMSPFSNTKLGLDKWLKYCELMILGLSIRKCAEEVGVGVKTSFYMRHRILDVINLSLKNDKNMTINILLDLAELFVEKHEFDGAMSLLVEYKGLRDTQNWKLSQRFTELFDLVSKHANIEIKPLKKEYFENLAEKAKRFITESLPSVDVVLHRSSSLVYIS